MTEGQVHASRLNPAKVVDRQEVYVPNYFLDWAFEEVQRLMKAKGEYVLTARTTVDVRSRNSPRKPSIRPSNARGDGPARVRLREPARLADLVPRHERRPAREPARRPVRT